MHSATIYSDATCAYHTYVMSECGVSLTYPAKAMAPYKTSCVTGKFKEFDADNILKEAQWQEGTVVVLANVRKRDP